MTADSIPSSCIKCSAPYYKQGDFPFYVMSFFCVTCRALLTSRKWMFLEHLNVFVWVIDSSGKYTLPHEEILIVRLHILSHIFDALQTNAPREKITGLLQDTHFFPIMQEYTLDFIELLEEYDQLIKEQEK